MNNPLIKDFEYAPFDVIQNTDAVRVEVTLLQHGEVVDTQEFLLDITPRATIGVSWWTLMMSDWRVALLALFMLAVLITMVFVVVRLTHKKGHANQ
jgi:hypothetical protein